MSAPPAPTDRTPWIVDARRTAFGAARGALARIRADDLAALPIADLLTAHPGLDPGRIADIAWGNTNGAGEDNRHVARMIRATDLTTLGRLRPAFSSGGSVTAGNASPINDGAVATLMASGAAVTEHDWTPLGRILGAAVVGVPPEEFAIAMGHPLGASAARVVVDCLRHVRRAGGGDRRGGGVHRRGSGHRRRGRGLR